MNDEGTVLENQTQDLDSSHDFVEATPQTTKESLTSQGEETPLRGATETPVGVSADSDADSHSDCESADPTIKKSELEQLRSELSELRKELEKRDARLAQMTQVEHQYVEFCSLYPDTPIHSLPAEVWQGVENGNSLAAAFALAEHRRALSLQKASTSNAENRARSAGAVGNTENVEFSPAEVRAMSSVEVRANLPKIMRSMQKWHKN